jgi:hypothetical protein
MFCYDFAELEVNRQLFLSNFEDLLAGIFYLIVLCGLAKAASLTITNGDQNQPVVVQNSTLATAIFTGFITNHTDAAITFQLSSGRCHSDHRKPSTRRE